MPRLLDLYCGAGLAADGYHAAGFEIVGIDINPQPNYPYTFIQADALDYLTFANVAEMYDAVHASCPCQAYSDLARRHPERSYPRLIEPTRALLRKIGLPYVMENVPEAPLIDPVILCGTMFPSLRVIRHRGFETNWNLPAKLHPPGHPLVFTHDKRKDHYGQLDQDISFVQVTGGGNCTIDNKHHAMGMTHRRVTNTEINEGIPPFYTHYVGAHLHGNVR